MSAPPSSLVRVLGRRRPYEGREHSSWSRSVASRKKHCFTAAIARAMENSMARDVGSVMGTLLGWESRAFLRFPETPPRAWDLALLVPPDHPARLEEAVSGFLVVGLVFDAIPRRYRTRVDGARLDNVSHKWPGGNATRDDDTQALRLQGHRAAGVVTGAGVLTCTVRNSSCRRGAAYSRCQRVGSGPPGEIRLGLRFRTRRTELDPGSSTRAVAVGAQGSPGGCLRPADHGIPWRRWTFDPTSAIPSPPVSASRARYGPDHRAPEPCDLDCSNPTPSGCTGDKT